MALRLYSHHSARGDQLKDFPFISESALQGYIEENPEILEFLHEDGKIKVVGLEKPWERGNGKGRIDILVSFDEEYYCIVELKNDELDKAAFSQLKGYLDGSKEKSVPDIVNLASAKWEGVLVGTSKNKDLDAIVEAYNRENKNSPISIVVITRYKYGDELFSMVDTYSPVNKRNYDKWLVDGVAVKKSRSVLSMVRNYKKRYDEKNPMGLSVEVLKGLLGAFKIGYMFVIKDRADAEAESKKLTRNGTLKGTRYHVGEDAIDLVGGSIVVLGCFGQDDFNDVKKIADVLGCEFSSS